MHPILGDYQKRADSAALLLGQRKSSWQRSLGSLPIASRFSLSLIRLLGGQDDPGNDQNRECCDRTNQHDDSLHSDLEFRCQDITGVEEGVPGIYCIGFGEHSLCTMPKDAPGCWLLGREQVALCLKKPAAGVV